MSTEDDILEAYRKSTPTPPPTPTPVLGPMYGSERASQSGMEGYRAPKGEEPPKPPSGAITEAIRLGFSTALSRAQVPARLYDVLMDKANRLDDKLLLMVGSFADTERATYSASHYMSQYVLPAATALGPDLFQTDPKSWYPILERVLYEVETERASLAETPGQDELPSDIIQQAVETVGKAMMRERAQEPSTGDAKRDYGIFLAQYGPLVHKAMLPRYSDIAADFQYVQDAHPGKDITWQQFLQQNLTPAIEAHGARFGAEGVKDTEVVEDISRTMSEIGRGVRLPKGQVYNRETDTWETEVPLEQVAGYVQSRGGEVYTKTKKGLAQQYQERGWVQVDPAQTPKAKMDEYGRWWASPADADPKQATADRYQQKGFVLSQQPGVGELDAFGRYWINPDVQRENERVSQQQEFEQGRATVQARAVREMEAAGEKAAAERREPGEVAELFRQRGYVPSPTPGVGTSDKFNRWWIHPDIEAREAEAERLKASQMKTQRVEALQTRAQQLEATHKTTRQREAEELIGPTAPQNLSYNYWGRELERLEETQKVNKQLEAEQMRGATDPNDPFYRPIAKYWAMETKRLAAPIQQAQQGAADWMVAKQEQASEQKEAQRIETLREAARTRGLSGDDPFYGPIAKYWQRELEEKKPKITAPIVRWNFAPPRFTGFQTALRRR